MAQQLDALARDLLAAAGSVLAETRAVVQKGALNVKNEAQANVLKSAPTRNAYAHQAITYDTGVSATEVDAEIGFDKERRGGALGNILEYGSRNNPPQLNLARALEAEEPRFVKAMGDVADRLL